MTLDDKLEVLAGCGLRVEDQDRLRDAIDDVGREYLDAPGYDRILGLLAAPPDQDRVCPSLFHLDTECIYEDGDYAQIASIMAQISTLPVTDIEDHVDPKNEFAWLRFRCGERSVHIDCEFQDDWIDPAIFSDFVDLLNAHDSQKVYFVFSSEGQDCIIGCVTRPQLDCLRQLIPELTLLT